MPMYSFYWLGTDNHIKAADYVVCETDEDAKRDPLQRIRYYASVEIWCQSQYIARMMHPGLRELEGSADAALASPGRGNRRRR